MLAESADLYRAPREMSKSGNVPTQIVPILDISFRAIDLAFFPHPSPHS
jgi:hypothetical protein